MDIDNPILNGPYDLPVFHYATDLEGALDYSQVVGGRRYFMPGIVSMPQKQTDQKSIWEANEMGATYGTHLVNLLRDRVSEWRAADYPNVTRVTQELLRFWFLNPDRIATKKLFFAQREAVETAIYLNEVAAKSNAGQHVLNLISIGQKNAGTNPNHHLPRIAFKMATGTGKTVVMGCLILYHFFNRQEYRSDTRFADYFLIVAPGVTIRDRLGVLFVDISTKHKHDRADYYAARDLVPTRLELLLGNLNAKLVVTNYHAFEPKTLQGNKRSPFDGKIGADGKKQEAMEDYNQVFKRLIGKFRKDSRVMVLNDEAHHCYFPLAKGKTEDNEDSDENAKAAVWFSGLAELSKRYKLQQVYDLSATPYYLKGSGYDAYSLFPWVASDFGLIEAIEAGLVKIPFMPVGDSTQNLQMPVLRNLYDHVKDELPKKGQRKQKKDAKEEGKFVGEAPPQLPVLVKGALDQFYNHYKDYYEGNRKREEGKVNLFTAPPVFIAVCNNTSVSKELYKFIAGYEVMDANGEVVRAVDGAYDLFSNYDPVTKRPKAKSPTLLIDSSALEDSDQVSDEFKKIFKTEIESFKRDYARLKGQGAAENITDAEILREVVNTVGKPGKLGGHIRCVVSVSMLTEGWDANTVTHIMGLRAFGSQLLCEQVAGRALRRMNYHLQGYDKDGMPTDDKRKTVIEKFPPEYAHIIGVPFKLFKGGKGTTVDPPNYTRVAADPTRKALEIEFPNVQGYRIEQLEGAIKHDFTGIEDFNFDCSKFPLETTMASSFSDREEKIEVKSVLEKREQEIIYLLTKELINFHFSDADHSPQFHLFGKLKVIVEQWYAQKLRLLNEPNQDFKRLIFFESPKRVVDHIARAINPERNTSEFVRVVSNYYNPTGSTQYVQGNTVREVYPTKKSHVNYVVMDSEWEGIAAKTLEEMPEVISYVKNQFMGFAIPYVKDGKDREYFVDLIAKVRSPKGEIVNLMIEITGFNKDKAEKKWYVENRWLPGVNAAQEKHQLGRWAFIEIADDIRDIKNQILQKIKSL